MKIIIPVKDASLPTNQHRFDDDTSEEETVNEEEIYIQELDSQDSEMPVVEQQTQVRNGSVINLLKKLNLCHLAEILESENIDIDVLSDMTHDDLKSIGISTFGDRHKIIKEFKNTAPNIVQSIVAAPEDPYLCSLCGKHFSSPENLNKHMDSVHTQEYPDVYPDMEFSCINCEETFKTLSSLNDHSAVAHETAQRSRYGGGNLYDDINIHVMTMSMSEEEFMHRAESTALNIETISSVEIQKICQICTHECGSESLFELHMKEHEESRKFKCTDCTFVAESLDCLIMHENMEHYSLSVTSVESAIEEIIDLPQRKRKNTDRNLNSNVKKLKYRLY